MYYILYKYFIIFYIKIYKFVYIRISLKEIYARMSERAYLLLILNFFGKHELNVTKIVSHFKRTASKCLKRSIYVLNVFSDSRGLLRTNHGKNNDKALARLVPCLYPIKG